MHQVLAPIQPSSGIYTDLPLSIIFCQYNCEAVEKENSPLQMIYTHIIVLPLLL